MNFQDLSATDVTAIVNAAVFPWQESNHLFYRGDHFQTGAGWIGPGPGENEVGRDALLERLEPAFISQNAVKSAIDTKVNAALGREPRWGMVPNEPMPDKGDEKALKVWKAKWEDQTAQADALLTAWYDRRKIHEELQKFAAIYETEGRALLRLFVPPGQLEDGNVPAGDLEASLNRLYVEAVRPNLGRVYLNRDAMAEIGIYLFTEETQGIDPRTNEVIKTVSQKAELTWLEDGKTILRTVGKKDDKGAVATDEGEGLELNGNLWHFQAEGEPLITPQVRALNKLLNLALTTSSRNLSDNGWLEEFLINTQMPGSVEEVTTTNGETTTTEKRFIPAAVGRGPGRTRHLVSQTVPETNPETGAISSTVLPADVKWRPPVDPTNTIATKEAIEDSIAQEVHQKHTLKRGADGNASGEALKQHRADFVANLNHSVSAINAAGRWLIETALLLAVAFSKQPNPFADLRVNFECRVDAGPLSADELRELQAMKDSGSISLETFMAMTGVDDVDAEQARIESERAGNLDAAKVRADIAGIAGVASTATGMAYIFGGGELDVEAALKEMQERRAPAAQGMAPEPAVTI